MLKKLTLPLAAVLVAVSGAASAADVGVSVSVVQPGVYGRVDVGNAPPPVVYTQPVVVAPAPVVEQPVYLYVPTNEQEHWAQYCGRYGACSRPVYFVQENWVRERWEHDRGRHRGHAYGREHERGEHERGEHERDEH